MTSPQNHTENVPTNEEVPTKKDRKRKDDFLVQGCTYPNAVKHLKELTLSTDSVLFLPSGNFHLTHPSPFEGITYGDHILKYAVSTNEGKVYLSTEKKETKICYVEVFSNT